MRTIRYNLAVLLATMLAVVSPVIAQDIVVTVTPVQPVLPPQVSLYLTNPGNYFDILVTNNSVTTAQVYLVMQANQVNPASGLSVSTPDNRPPLLPISVMPGKTERLDPALIRGLFNHIPINEIKAPQTLFNNYANGSFGLLPEGQYEVHFTAMKWEDPKSNGGKIANPVILSSPTGGYAYFNVCYNAQAPQFLTPSLPNQGQELQSLSVAEIDPASPQFTWQAPVLACNQSAIQYTYSMRVVEVLPGQNPVNSMDHNPVVYQANKLTTPLCIIPFGVVKTMKTGTTYAAQVTASVANSNNKMLNYVSVENEGKSPYRLFRLKGSVSPGSNDKDNNNKGLDNVDKGNTPKVDLKDDGVGKSDKKDDKNEKKDDNPKKDDDPDAEDDESDSDISIWMGRASESVEITDSVYTFRVPRIIDPLFPESSGARKVFTNTNIDVAWEQARFAGGEGLRSDTIQIEYDIQLFDNGERADIEEAIKQKPIYNKRIKSLKQLKDTIMWKDIEESIEAGDYMVLRVNPVVVKGVSVGFSGTDNIIDFALAKRLSKQYFQCSNMVEVDDSNPTTKTANDLKGKEVAIGEYQMIIDEISGDASKGFNGKGRVIWEPFGSKIKVCVKFDKLKINSDDIVYEGIAETYAAPSMSSLEVVDNLFSEWGIDNLIADANLPNAKYLSGEAKNKVKSIAENANLGKYYDSMKKSGEVLKLLTTGEMDKLYMPVKFPTEVFKADFDAVDVQIAGMKFAPTYATMNVIGQSVLPECNVLESKMLVFGAPRLCVSPNRFLPESGHLALLGDFTLTPNSDTKLTFKAPHDLLEPTDGCYISWHNEKFELLGIDADLFINDLMQEKDGKIAKDAKGNPICPAFNMKLSFGTWDDLLAKLSFDGDFQIKDLPGYTFHASDFVYDHSKTRNEKMASFPKAYSKQAADCGGNDEEWQGLYIGEVSVKFPKSFEFGDVSDKDEGRLKLIGKGMFFDKSGVTLKMGVEDAFEVGKKGKLGTWAFSIDEAMLEIVQDKFDNCYLKGGINVPLFSAKDDKGNAKNIAYTCDIRRFSDPKKNKQGESERTRLSYVFLVEPSNGDLTLDCFLADLNLDADQTYFVVESYDGEKEDDDMITNVELCLGGTIGIGAVDNANEWLKKKTEDQALKLKIPDVHFTKMRISNVERSKWVSVSDLVKAKQTKRESKEKAEADAAIYTFIYSEEMKIADNFYFDVGEWSFASEKKRVGPFSFSIDEFKPSITNNAPKESGGTKGENVYTITLAVSGSMGLCGDVVCVEAGFDILTDIDTHGKLKDIAGWDISFDRVKFKKIGVEVDVAEMLHFKGDLEIIEDGTDKGYKGSLTIDIKGFFSLDCTGGYFNHEVSKDEKVDTGELTGSQEEDKESYAWGYFTICVKSSAGIHIDPVVINRISGGFYFNCRPTKGGDHDFSGTPTPQYGMIGVAFGIGLSTTAGEQALKADVDLLVVYDQQNSCLSTFMFNGKIEAVGGMVKANCSIIYENQMKGKKSFNRYFCINITVDAGMDTNGIAAKLAGANAKLKGVQDKLNKLQEDLGSYLPSKGSQCGMKALSGKDGGDKKNELPDGDVIDPDATVDAEPSAKKTTDTPGFTAGSVKITLEFMVTWVKNGTEYNTPKWHLYLGEPSVDKRCTFTYLKYDGKLVHVDIGANAYICLGNELPNNGQLPAIPSKISEFLDQSSSSADAGGSTAQANASRAKAAKALLNPNSCEGGVMVGASAWGNIRLDLGLLYGGLDAIAGFDCSLVHYGDGAFCMNSGKVMGYNGWYAMGQLYAYLAADLGVHVKIGKLINEKIKFFSGKIGGLLEVGLPNPTWVEGKLRIKISLLDGLFNLDKRFEFSAGDHCVPFRGNALDGFEMFQNVNFGSDSLVQAICDPTYQISLNDAKHMTFTTASSIGSHYRLLDPSWVEEIEKNLKPGAEPKESTEQDYENNLALHGSRTYVFDINQDKDLHGMKMGVRLFDLGIPYYYNHYAGTPLNYSPGDCLKRWDSGDTNTSKLAKVIVNNFSEPKTSLIETSLDYGTNKELNATPKGYLEKSQVFEELEKTANKKYRNGSDESCEIDVSFREDKGTTFHLTGMDNLKRGHAYALYLTANAYEIDNGRRVWCEYIHNQELHRIKWQQGKFWFFLIKAEDNDIVVGDSLRSIEPYVALAYPSIDGTKTLDDRNLGTIKAYYKDIMKPTIALNRDISKELPASKMKWYLTVLNEAGDTIDRQSQDAVYVKWGNCLNLEPKFDFAKVKAFTSGIAAAQDAQRSYDFSKEIYHLQLAYSYSHQDQKTEWSFGRSYKKNVGDPRDSTRYLVNLWLTPMPHDLKVNGKTHTDSWLETSLNNVREALPYSQPFVGAKANADPVLAYYDAEKKLTDKQVIGNGYVYNNIPYRLIDPYLYFSYLGKYAFIGDRAINAYNFDDAFIPFGSETLIFSYNTAIVNPEVLKNETSKSLIELRDQMYGLWNDWWKKGNTTMPRYPLPAHDRSGHAIGNLTVGNQDGKVRTVIPRNVNHDKEDYTYAVQDLARSYAGAYIAADLLCDTLKHFSSQFMDQFYSWRLEPGDTRYSIDYQVRKWNQTYRGRYIEIDTLGFNVRIPFYQLPLLFGNCFGTGAYALGSSFGKQYLEGTGRSFESSIGKKSLARDDVWCPEMSNLLFFRLNDWASSAHPKIEKSGYRSTYTSTSHWMSNSWLPQVWSFWPKGQEPYSSIYQTQKDGQNPQVAWDNFRGDKGLAAVSKFEGQLYRVDAYDMNTGQYCLSNPDSDSGRGGGPWLRNVSIDANNKVAGDLYQMMGAVEEQEKYLETHYDEPQPQVIGFEDKYIKGSKGKTVLIFVYNDSIYTDKDKDDGKFRGIPIKYYWHGTEVIEKKPWASLGSEVGDVRIEKTFKEYLPTSTAYWFQGFKYVNDIQGLQYINTSRVTDMSYMFYNCESLIAADDDGKWDTSNVTDMSYMFCGCSSLVRFQKTGWIGVASLKTFKTSKVKDMSYMFSGCKKLTRAEFDNFTSDSLTSMSNMFYNCTSLEKVFLDGMMGSEANYTDRMFYGCSKLSEIHFKNFEPWDEKLDKGRYTSMFTNVPKTVNCWVSNDLTEKISNQIPGRQLKQYNNNNKCFLITSADPADGNTAYDYPILAFVKTNVNVPKPQEAANKLWIDEDTPTITLNVEGKPKKYWFHLAWSGSDLAYNWESDSKKWDEYKEYKKYVQRVIIDKSYSSKAPAVLQNLFGEMESVKEIIGLENLRTSETTSMNSAFKDCHYLKSLNLKNFNTSKVTTMERMFEGCESLEELDVSNFNTDKVTSMWYMFKNCTSLKKLTLRKSANDKSFNTQKVKYMMSMFQNCSALQKIDLGGPLGTLNTSSVEAMDNMFFNCFSPEYADQDASFISQFNTSNLKEASGMFYECNLSSLDLSRWKMDNITNMQGMFNHCQFLKELWIFPNTLPKLNQGGSMFQRLPNTCTIYLDPHTNSNVDVTFTPAKIVYIQPMYAFLCQSGSKYILYFKTLGKNEQAPKVGSTYNGNNIYKVWSGMDVMDREHKNGQGQWNWYGSQVQKVVILNDIAPTNCEYFFANLSGITSIEGLSHLKLNKCKSLRNMFYNCKSLTEIKDFSYLGSTAKDVEDMSSMFSSCENLKSIDFSGWANYNGGQYNVTNMNNMFYYCKSLTSVNLKGIKTPKLKSMKRMFWKCSSLTEVDLSGFNTSALDNTTDLDGGTTYMFEECTSLKKVNVKDLNVKGTRSLTTFYGMPALEELDLSTLDTEGMEYVPTFKGCSSLRKLQLGAKFDVSKVHGGFNKNQFEGVTGLSVITPTASLSAIRKAFIDYGGFKEGDTGQFSDKEPAKEAQAIWTASNKTLTFIYGLPVGSTYNGYTVTNKWKGNEVLANTSNNWAPWTSTVKSTLEKVVIDNTFVNAKPTSTRGWFYNLQKMTSIVGIKNLNTSNVTDMGYMFYQCEALNELDLSGFNTSNVTNMERMFYYLNGVKELNLSKFNTSKVTKMDEMFRSNSNGKLKMLDLTSFNTSNVTSAYAMFSFYYKLKEIKVGSNFTLPKVSSKQSSVFTNVSGCEIVAKSSQMSTVKTAFKDKLGFVEGTNGEFVESDKRIAQAIWTVNTKTLHFYYGRQYKVGDTFKNQRVTNVWSGNDVERTPVNNMSVPWTSTVKDLLGTVWIDEKFVDARPIKTMCWFYGCSKLISVSGLEYLNTVNTSDFDAMFSGCTSLYTIDVSKLKTPNASYLCRMFQDCSKLKYIDVSNFSTKWVRTMSNMFSGCTSLVEINGIGDFETGRVTNMQGMFNNCSKLIRLNLWKWDTSNVTNMSNMFYNCASLTYLETGKFDTRNVTTMRSMFNKCKSLKDISVGGFNMTNVKDMSYMFYECNAATTLSISTWKATSVTDLSYMFYHCGLNNSLSMMSVQTTSTANLNSMFEGCERLRSVYLSKTLKSTTKTTNMFKNCKATKYYY